MRMPRQPNSPYRRLVKVTVPAAGANFAWSPDRGALAVVRTILFVLATSATVATRTAIITASDGNDVFFRTMPGGTQINGQTIAYSGFSGSATLSTVGPGELLAWPTDGLYLLPGFVLASAVDQLQVGDQLSGIMLDVEELPLGPDFRMYPTENLYVEDQG
jgi:hypothetical protein